MFISSVMEELRDERAAAADGVRSLGARPVMFEEFGGRDADPQDAYLGEVETSPDLRRHSWPTLREAPAHALLRHAR